jgi:4-hydroxythreonine-4-phosphate dehydrogenase
MSEKPIIVGVTQGDINGISYEVILKTFMDSRIMEVCTPLVYGSSKAASYYRKLLKNVSDFSFHITKQADQLSNKNPNIINVTDKEIKIDKGEATPVAGEMAVMSLKRAAEDWLSRKIDVLVTSPINMKNIEPELFPYLGQAAYLAHACNTNDYLMLMISDRLKIGTVTTHCPITEVGKQLNKDFLLRKIHLLNKSLEQDFLITKPKIAVLSLNSYVEKHEKFDREEQNIIIPAIEEAYNRGIYVFGPYVAERFFETEQYTKFDGVLAMHPDQATVPLEMLPYGDSVNFTAGLPFVHTSPTHGTAYSIAGKDKASPDSFRNAIYSACDIYRNRRQFMDNDKQ